MSLAIAGILPLINLIGVAATNTLSAFLALLGFGLGFALIFSSISNMFLIRLLWFTIRYGDRMRAWVDVGYSTAENN
jgi:hypothetical protein